MRARGLRARLPAAYRCDRAVCRGARGPRRLLLRLLHRLLRGGAGPVVRVRGHEEADADAPPGGARDPPDHPPVGDVRIDDVELLARPVEQPRDLVRDRAVAAWSVVEDDRRDRAAVDNRTLLARRR